MFTTSRTTSKNSFSISLFGFKPTKMRSFAKKTRIHYKHKKDNTKWLLASGGLEKEHLFHRRNTSHTAKYFPSFSLELHPGVSSFQTSGNPWPNGSLTFFFFSGQFRDLEKENSTTSSLFFCDFFKIKARPGKTWQNKGMQLNLHVFQKENFRSQCNSWAQRLLLWQQPAAAGGQALWQAMSFRAFARE